VKVRRTCEVRRTYWRFVARRRVAPATSGGSPLPRPPVEIGAWDLRPGVHAGGCRLLSSSLRCCPATGTRTRHL